MMTVSDVTFSYGGSVALDRVSVSLGEGELVAIVGPNGSGKSTLLKLMARVYRPSGGAISFEGRDVIEWGPRDYACEVGYLPQELEPAFALRALDVVLSARGPFLSRFAWESERDREIAKAALARCDASHLSGRSLDQMSGGERKRVFLARVLAGTPRLLLLDEPFAALDLSHIQALFRVLLELTHTERKTIVFVSHDLNWSAAFADRMMVMDKGLVAAFGTPQEVMTAEVMRRHFQFEGEVVTNSRGRPWVVPRSVEDDPARAILSVEPRERR